MDTFTWIPSITTRGTAAPRVLEAQLGQGYSQRTRDGINADLRPWDLVFNPMHATQQLGPDFQSLFDIDTFLTGKGGSDAFLWTPPTPYDGTPLAFVCKQWDWSYDDGGAQVSLRASFQQVPL